MLRVRYSGLIWNHFLRGYLPTSKKCATPVVRGVLPTSKKCTTPPYKSADLYERYLSGGTYLPRRSVQHRSSRGYLGTYLPRRSVQRWHRNLPTLEKERNPEARGRHQFIAIILHDLIFIQISALVKYYSGVLLLRFPLIIIFCALN